MSIEKIDNLDPNVWGPNFWHTMEAIAVTLDSENKMDIYRFFENLRHVIPCKTCKHHYQEYFLQKPIKNYLNNQLTLLSWLYSLRCDIKKRQEKSVESFQDYVEQIIERYDVPEINFLIDKHHENLKIIQNLKIKNPLDFPFLRKRWIEHEI